MYRNTRGGRREDRRLLRIVDEEMRRATALAGSWLICGPGCSDCCHGPFPITVLDVERLRRGLADFREREPERGAAIAHRARNARQELVEGYPGDPVSGKPSADEKALDDFFVRHSKMACPVLDPETGQCELYDSRPIACRTYGPPLTYGSEASRPCPLCFAGASPDEIERCRVQPDREGLEDRLLDQVLPPGGNVWETLIAFALEGRA